jgi:hypothetical protein
MPSVGVPQQVRKSPIFASIFIHFWALVYFSGSVVLWGF